MNIQILPANTVPGLWPITKELADFKVAGKTIRELLHSEAADYPAADTRIVELSADLIPSPVLWKRLATAASSLRIQGADGKVLATVRIAGAPDLSTEPPDAQSLRISHPWDLLHLNEVLVGAMTENDIRGTVRNNVTIDGKIRLGSGSVILPGVYIEGNAIFGDNCKIGPNCYIRGNTAVGDNCHIGQAVEIKNSLLGDRVAVGHLSYAGDSVICDHVNFGAGTIISNLRHDGLNHKWLQNAELLDTGRRKFGAIIGENVHTGIHTSIYPGRSLSPGSSTIPGEVVARSK